LTSNQGFLSGITLKSKGEKHENIFYKKPGRFTIHY